MDTQKRLEAAQQEYDFCVRMHQQYRITARLVDALASLNKVKAEIASQTH